MEKIIIKKTVSEWIELFEINGIPGGRINSIDKVMSNKQILARNMIVEVEDKKIGSLKIAGNPIKMSNIPDSKTRKTAPEIGENNAEILSKMLNFDEAKIEKLKKDGVI